MNDTRPPNDIQLRAHQTRSIDALRDSIRSGNRRVVLQLPCGGGKTFIASTICKSVIARGKRALMLVDQNELLEQGLAAFDMMGLRAGVIRYKHDRYDRDADVQVMTQQTLLSRLRSGKERARFEEMNIGVCFVDECHVRFAVVQQLMELLGDEVIWIGLSATPWQDGMADVWHDLVVVTTVPELIEQGHLVPTDVYSHPAPDLSGVKVRAGEYVAKQADEAYEPHLMGDVISTWKEQAEHRSTILFASTRAGAAGWATRFQQSGYDFAAVDGKTPPEERAEIMAAFRAGELTGLCTVMLAIKGFDAPIASCMIDCAPTKSRIVHVQRMGRIQRTHPDKESAIALDHSGNFLRHGLPDGPQPECFSDKQAAEKEKTETEREPEQAQPLPCLRCGMLRSRVIAACPGCGYRWVREEIIEHMPGKLQLLTGGQTIRHGFEPPPPALTATEWYAMLIRHATNRKYKPGWAAFAYKDRFGSWPPGGHVYRPGPAKEIAPAVERWIKAYARKRRRETTPPLPTLDTELAVRRAQE